MKTYLAFLYLLFQVANFPKTISGIILEYSPIQNIWKVGAFAMSFHLLIIIIGIFPRNEIF